MQPVTERASTGSTVCNHRRFLGGVAAGLSVAGLGVGGVTGKLPRPTRSLPPCGGRSLLEGGAFPQRHCAPRPHVVRESEALSSSRKAQSAFRTTWRGPASFSRPRAGQRVGVVAVTRAYGTRPVDCLAGLIPGVLALSPQSRDGSRTRSRSSVPSAGPKGVALGPQK